MKYVKLFEDWKTYIDNTHIGHWLAQLEHFLISQNIEMLYRVVEEATILKFEWV
jgi:hypothetical protein